MATYEVPQTAYIGYEELTAASNVVKGLTPPISSASGNPAQTAIIQCQKATARVRFAGGNPTGNSGFMLAAGDTLILRGTSVSDARFMSDTASNPLLSIHYFD